MTVACFFLLGRVWNLVVMVPERGGCRILGYRSTSWNSEMQTGNASGCWVLVRLLRRLFFPFPNISIAKKSRETN